MRVFRIETPTCGQGPWSSSLYYTAVGLPLERANMPYGKHPTRMPTLPEDKHLQGRPRKETRDGRFAYPSLEVLFKWWEVCVGIVEAFVVSIYEAEGEPSVYENQVVFDDGKRLASYTLEECYRHWKNGTLEWSF